MLRFPCYWFGEGVLSLDAVYATSLLSTDPNISQWSSNGLGGWLLAELATQFSSSRSFYLFGILTADWFVPPFLMKSTSLQQIWIKYFCALFLYTRYIKVQRPLAALRNAQPRCIVYHLQICQTYPLAEFCYDPKITSLYAKFYGKECIIMCTFYGNECKFSKLCKKKKNSCACGIIAKITIRILEKNHVGLKSVQ